MNSKYLSKASAERGLLSLDQAQEELECSRSKVYRLGRLGKLELVKFDTRTMVTEDSLRRLLSETRPLGRSA